MTDADIVAIVPLGTENGMAGYVKLFSEILDSSVWQESHETRLVWITMLAKADRDGVVWASVPGLAHAARVGIEECEFALMRLSEPDQYSRNKEWEGRRIREVDGGWLVLNHAKYRERLSKEDRREYNRMKQAEHRARKKLPPVSSGTKEEQNYVKAYEAGQEV